MLTSFINGSFIVSKTFMLSTFELYEDTELFNSSIHLVIVCIVNYFVEHICLDFAKN